MMDESGDSDSNSDNDSGNNSKSVTSTNDKSGVQEGEEEFVRLVMITLTGQKKVYTLQPDPVYWPSMDLKREIDGVWNLKR